MSIPALVATRLTLVPPPHISFEATAAAMATSTGHSVGVRHEQQNGTFWCWAAVSVAMRSFVRKDLPAISQCDFASLHLKHAHTCCANDHALEACDVQGVLEDALAAAGVKVQPPEAPFPSTVRSELVKDRPVCALIEFPNAPNHFVQIDGFKAVGGSHNYVINDPQRGVLDMPEDDLKNNYHNEKGRWRRSYLLA
jgi:hypothetical protein